jgi:hypothetical protein
MRRQNILPRVATLLPVYRGIRHVLFDELDHLSSPYGGDAPPQMPNVEIGVEPGESVERAREERAKHGAAGVTEATVFGNDGSGGMMNGPTGMAAEDDSRGGGDDSTEPHPVPSSSVLRQRKKSKGKRR